MYRRICAVFAQSICVRAYVFLCMYVCVYVFLHYDSDNSHYFPIRRDR
jgi:hypothetical protein